MVQRYERGSLEFARVASFSEAVFAIAMTLLVVSIGVAKLGPGRRLTDVSTGSSPGLESGAK